MLMMGNEKFVTRVGNAAIKGVDQTEAFIDFTQNQGTGVGGETAALENPPEFFWSRDLKTATVVWYSLS